MRRVPWLVRLILIGLSIGLALAAKAAWINSDIARQPGPAGPAGPTGAPGSPAPALTVTPSPGQTVVIIRPTTIASPVPGATRTVTRPAAPAPTRTSAPRPTPTRTTRPTPTPSPTCTRLLGICLP